MVQPSVASQEDEWQVPAAAVIGLQKMSGRIQPSLGLSFDLVNCCN
jgi:hypothetical protein